MELKEFVYDITARDEDGNVDGGQIVVQADSDINARRYLIGTMMKIGRNVLNIERIEPTSQWNHDDDDDDDELQWS